MNRIEKKNVRCRSYWLPSYMPTANSRFLRVKCSPMNGDDFVGKLRNKYGSPSRTSGLCDTFTFSPAMSSHSFVKSHSRSVQSNEPVARMVPSRLKHNECTVPVWPLNEAIRWPCAKSQIKQRVSAEPVAKYRPHVLNANA